AEEERLLGKLGGVDGERPPGADPPAFPEQLRCREVGGVRGEAEGQKPVRLPGADPLPRRGPRFLRARGIEPDDLPEDGGPEAAPADRLLRVSAVGEVDEPEGPSGDELVEARARLGG